MTTKQRLTATVDPDVVAAGHQAVALGEADSVSSWVNTALREKAQRDQKLRLLAAVIAEYELEFGEITAAEIAAQQRVDREQAIVVRGSRRTAPATTRSAKRSA